MRPGINAAVGVYFWWITKLTDLVDKEGLWVTVPVSRSLCGLLSAHQGSAVVLPDLFTVADVFLD